MNAQLVVAKSGSVRTNQAWIISRLLRDFEQRMSEETYETDKSAPKYEALRISVFEIDQQVDPGTMTHDWKWYSGFAVILLQLVVSCIPVILYSNWFVVTITAAGTMLALIQGTFPQWKKEKWASTKTGGSTVSISQGNGSRHVMTILGRDHTPSEQLKNYKGLDLEILAGGSKRFRPAKHSTQLALLLTILWTALLISVAGLQEDSWFLLAAGIIGMMHSIFVAGATRSPGVYGIHLKPVEAITARKVAMVLHEAEEKYPTVGSSLIPVFFPGRMYVNKEEIEFWDAAAERRGLKGAEELPVAVKPTIE
ncbi:MAG: hypothetical protein M1820_004382 [Bogoriella megaspora]|nr:MAG: hypothetical protein M1820_004382 [Bogoriella megaspora]